MLLLVWAPNTHQWACSMWLDTSHQPVYPIWSHLQPLCPFFLSGFGDWALLLLCVGHPRAPNAGWHPSLLNCSGLQDTPAGVAPSPINQRVSLLIARRLSCMDDCHLPVRTCMPMKPLLHIMTQSFCFIVLSWCNINILSKISYKHHVYNQKFSFLVYFNCFSMLTSTGIYLLLDSTVRFSACLERASFFSRKAMYLEW